MDHLYSFFGFAYAGEISCDSEYGADARTALQDTYQ
jgi:hypothetical protein